MIEEWDLTATNLFRIQRRKYEVSVLPVGAVEAHNYHLPEGQDWRHTTYVARESCRRAWEQCQAVVCLPAIPFGVDCNLLDFPLTIHVSQASLDSMIRDIARSLRAHHIRKLVIVNGHGGNNFTPLIRQLQCDSDIHLFLCHWWTVGLDRYAEIFEEPDDHAGEMETSVALALYPGLVELGQAGKGQVKPFRFEALQKGWIKTSRNFKRLNEHCACGAPGKATAEKGIRYLELVCSRISQFLVQLAQTPIDDAFPHQV